MKNRDYTPLAYTPLFCEENIWKLLEASYTRGWQRDALQPLHVLFIINANNTVALFGQGEAENHQPLIWDYHVILSAMLHGRPVIYDFDSQCDFPADLTSYFYTTFPLHTNLNHEYRPLIRRIDAEAYFQQFSSDRQHMAGVIPESQFPDYPLIHGNSQDSALSLQQCRDLNSPIADSQTLYPYDYFMQLLVKQV
ncbi:MAG TPA: hypothetical protein VIQ81_02960 [Gammaproteobacteria bacterium]